MSVPLEFCPDLPLCLSETGLAIEYGRGVFGPQPEMRRLDAIRPSLRDPQCSGPDPVYGIAMDIGRESDCALLEERMLLFGAVAYAAGRLGDAASPCWRRPETRWWCHPAGRTAPSTQTPTAAWHSAPGAIASMASTTAEFALTTDSHGFLY